MELFGSWLQIVDKDDAYLSSSFTPFKFSFVFIVIVAILLSAMSGVVAQNCLRKICHMTGEEERIILSCSE